jgi:hypothetical protein
MNDSSLSVDPENIQRRAYAHWVERGRPHGSAEIDWSLAEEELLNELRNTPTNVEEVRLKL